MKPAPPVMKMRFPCRATAVTLAWRHAGRPPRVARRGVGHRRGVRRPHLAARAAAAARGRRARAGAREAARGHALASGLAAGARRERRVPRRRAAGRRVSHAPQRSAATRAARASCRRRPRATSARWRSRGASRATRGERRVLDVGYAFAEPAYLAGLVALGAAELVGVDLATADVPGLQPVVADVRKLPFPDASFDLAFCISTLEHVGRDNEVYDIDAARDEAGDEAALRELHRVLTKDGRLLISVPTGEHDDQGWQIVRDARGLDRIVRALRLSRLRGRALRARGRRLANRDARGREPRALRRRGSRRRSGAPRGAPPRHLRREDAASCARRPASRRDPAQHGCVGSRPRTGTRRR